MPKNIFLNKKPQYIIVLIIFFSFLLSYYIFTPEIKAASAPRIGDSYYNYGEALQKSILFYKANRLGDLPDDYILPYRDDACMTDGQDVGLDLTGGWADAGDGVKFGHPMAYAASQLSWAVFEYREAFEKSGQLDDILDEIKWATDYFIKAHPEPDVFYYDCGYGESDHSVWAPHELLEYLTERTSFKVDKSKPGSDVAGMTAATLALASLIFEDTEPDYAEKCLTHSKELFDFADTYRGKNPLNNFYQSGSYLDDLSWGAVWLYIKTKDESYLEKAKSYMPVASLGGHHTHCWDDVSYGSALKIAQLTKDQQYISMVEKNLDWWMPKGGLNYTPGGLAWLSQWGSLRYASTAAFLAFVWSDDETVCTSSKKEVYHNFAESQINYALGDNPRNGSYLVGFGKNPPEHPHHRTAHGSWVSMLTVPSFHRHILYGALVGGPDSSDGWEDNIADYTLNEVSCDYNAGFVGSVARMYYQYGGNPLENWPQPEDFRAKEDNLNEYFNRGWIIYEGYGTLNLMLQINNRSAWPPAMKDKLSARYFMDLSEVLDAGYTIDDVHVELGISQGAKLIPLKQYKGSIYYFTVDFTGTQLMPAEWELCEKDANIKITYTDNIGSNENDWSYQNLDGPPDYNAESFAGMTPYIPIYDNGKLLWGEEPTEPGQLPSVSPKPTSSSPSLTTLPESANFLVDYKVLNDWGSGANVNVLIINNSSSSLNNWTLKWTFSGNQKISSLWNGSYTQSDNIVTVKNVSYSATIPPNGGSVNFGFNMSYSGTNQKPTDFTLNGALIKSK